MSPIAALAAEKVSVRGWAHSEFGRFVLEWDKPVAYRADIRDGMLRIRFDRPLSADLSAVQKALARFIRSASTSPDGRVISARLTGEFGLRHFVNGKVVIVDLLAGKAAAARQPARRAASSFLSVRTGKHDRFGRLVFDWPGAVRYSVDRADGAVVVRFDKSVAIDTGALRRRLPGQIRGVTTRKTSRGLEVRLDPVPDARVRHFRDGTRVVVDIIAAPTGRPPKTAARPTPATPVKATPTPAPAKKTTPPRPREKAGAGPSKKVDKKQFRPLISVDIVKQAGGLSIRFNWREMVSAAVYRRGGRLWLLFDKAARIDLGGIRIAGRGIVSNVRQVKTPDSAWIELEIPPQQGISMSRDDKAWVLDLSGGRKKKPAATAATPVRINRGKGAAKVVVGVGKKVRLHRVYDPNGGDQLVIAPSSNPNAGIPRPYRFVKFDLLETAVGTVVRRKADDVSVRLNGTSLEVTAAEGLLLSDKESAEKPRVAIADTEPRRPLTYINEWGQDEEGGVAKGQQRLIDAILQAPPPKRNAARMNLARFYLANKMAAAALGVLKIVLRQDLSYERDLEYRSLRGAANYLVAHYGDAESDLNFSFLKKEPAVGPWLASIAAARGDWKSAHGLFAGSEPILANYPHWLAAHMRLLAVEAALAANDLKAAKKRLQGIGAGAMTDAQRFQIDYLKAFMLKKEGKPHQAIALWQQLGNASDRKVRAKSAFAETETLLEIKKIDPAQAIERLERLTYAWRGDSFEFDLLRRLGDLYTQRSNHRHALTRYRQAASYFESVDGAEAMTQQMSKTFNELYLKGGADKLSAVRALALYEEFRELTPAGAAGDDMIRQLADRLAAVDLLDEAGQLLDHQVKFRLKGPLQARVGARLALIRLLDLKPKDALEALDQSRVDEAAPELKRQRALLRAQALERLGRAATALATIKDDSSRDAELLRVAIHWRKNQWAPAATVLGRLLADSPTDRLDRETRRLVLQRAIALVLAKKKADLEKLRRRFGKAMMQGPNAEAFGAIAGGDIGKIPDYKTLAKQAGELATFEAFMESYRNQLKASQLSAIN